MSDYPFLEQDLAVFEKAAAARAKAMVIEFLDFQKASDDDELREELSEIMDAEFPRSRHVKTAERLLLPEMNEVLHEEVDYVSRALRHSLGLNQ